MFLLDDIISLPMLYSIKVLLYSKVKIIRKIVEKGEETVSLYGSANYTTKLLESCT